MYRWYLGQKLGESLLQMVRIKGIIPAAEMAVNCFTRVTF